MDDLKREITSHWINRRGFMKDTWMDDGTQNLKT